MNSLIMLQKPNESQKEELRRELTNLLHKIESSVQSVKRLAEEKAIDTSTAEFKSFFGQLLVEAVRVQDELDELDIK